MDKLTKKCIIVHKNGIIQVINYNNQGTCVPGEGFNFAEFETKEELDAYITSNKLTTSEEAIETLIAYKGEEKVDIEQHMFDDNVTLVLRDVEDHLQRNIE